MQVLTPKAYKQQGYNPCAIEASIRKAEWICRVVGASFAPIEHLIFMYQSAKYVVLILDKEEMDKWKAWDIYKDFDLPQWCRDILATWPRADHHVHKHQFIDGYYNTTGQVSEPYDGLLRIYRTSATTWSLVGYVNGQWETLYAGS